MHPRDINGDTREPDGRNSSIHSVSTDSEIIARSVHRPSVFSEIFERHARAIGGYARRRVGVDAADDVLSETFLVAFRRRSTFDQRWESARPWLLGIATHVIKQHRAAETTQWRAIAYAASVRDHLVASHAEDIDDRMDASSALHDLVPQIARLSAKDRDTLLLYSWGELTYEQVAGVMGIPIGTVRSRLNRVRRKLTPAGSGSADSRAQEEVEEQSDAAFGTSA